MENPEKTSDWYQDDTPSNPEVANTSAPASELQQWDNVELPGPATDYQGHLDTFTIMSSALIMGKGHVSNFQRSYGNVDFFRPYFDVDTMDVLRRIAGSLQPQGRPEILQKPDLYGPLMLTLTLAVILHINMKALGEQREGTLIGLALALCFGYPMISFAYRAACHQLAVQMRTLQIASLIGYGYTPHCIVLLCPWILKPVLAKALVGILGGLASVRMGLPFLKQAANKRNGTTLAIIVAVIHFLFLVCICHWYMPTEFPMPDGPHVINLPKPPAPLDHKVFGRD